VDSPKQIPVRDLALSQSPVVVQGFSVLMSYPRAYAMLEGMKRHRYISIQTGVFGLQYCEAMVGSVQIPGTFLYNVHSGGPINATQVFQR